MHRLYCWIGKEIVQSTLRARPEEDLQAVLEEESGPCDDETEFEHVA